MAILKLGATSSTTVAVKAPATLQVALQDIDSDDAGRNQKGTMVRDRVVGGANAKRKVSCTWKGLTSNETSQLLQAMSAVAFYVTYPDPYTGSNRTMKAYVGDRTLPIYKKNADGTYLWESLTANFVEY